MLSLQPQDACPLSSAPLKRGDRFIAVASASCVQGIFSPFTRSPALLHHSHVQSQHFCLFPWPCLADFTAQGPCGQPLLLTGRTGAPGPLHGLCWRDWGEPRLRCGAILSLSFPSAPKEVARRSLAASPGKRPRSPPGAKTDPAQPGRDPAQPGGIHVCAPQQLCAEAWQPCGTSPSRRCSPFPRLGPRWPPLCLPRRCPEPPRPPAQAALPVRSPPRLMQNTEGAKQPPGAMAAGVRCGRGAASPRGSPPAPRGSAPTHPPPAAARPGPLEVRSRRLPAPRGEGAAAVGRVPRPGLLRPLLGAAGPRPRPGAPAGAREAGGAPLPGLAALPTGRSGPGPARRLRGPSAAEPAAVGAAPGAGGLGQSREPGAGQRRSRGLVDAPGPPRARSRRGWKTGYENCAEPPVPAPALPGTCAPPRQAPAAPAPGGAVPLSQAGAAAPAPPGPARAPRADGEGAAVLPVRRQRLPVPAAGTSPRPLSPCLLHRRPVRSL